MNEHVFPLRYGSVINISTFMYLNITHLFTSSPFFFSLLKDFVCDLMLVFVVREVVFVIISSFEVLACRTGVPLSRAFKPVI